MSTTKMAVIIDLSEIQRQAQSQREARCIRGSNEASIIRLSFASYYLRLARIGTPSLVRPRRALIRTSLSSGWLLYKRVKGRITYAAGRAAITAVFMSTPIINCSASTRLLALSRWSLRALAALTPLTASLLLKSIEPYEPEPHAPISRTKSQFVLILLVTKELHYRARNVHHRKVFLSMTKAQS
jgi:hypothetical protein